MGSTTLTGDLPSNSFVTARLAATGGAASWTFAAPAAWVSTGTVARAYGAAPTSDGGFTVLGDFVGNLAFGSKTLTATTTGGDGFIATFGPAGNVTSAAAVGCPHYCGATAGAPVSGGHVLVGDFDDEITLDKTLGAANSGRRFYVGRRSTAGAWAWSIDIASAPGSAWSAKVVGLPGEAAFVTLGYWNGGVPTKGGQPLFADSGVYAVLLLAVKGDGTDLWRARIGGDADTRSFDLAVDAAGDIYVVGNCVGPVKLESGPATDLACGAGSDFVVKLEGTTGKLMWARVLAVGGPGPGPVVAASGGRVVVGGTYVGTLAIDGQPSPLPVAASATGYFAAFEQ